MAVESNSCSRILLVDDDALLLKNLEEWLKCHGYGVLTAKDGRQAIALARENPVDVVITDLQMPGFDGLELLALLKELDPCIEVIFLSGKATMDDAIAALRQGKAFDFLKKSSLELHKLELTLEKALARRARSRSAELVTSCVGSLENLTQREREVLELLSQGLENREIADKACLSERTVRNYLSSIYEKLGVSNRTQAVLFCQQTKISSSTKP